MTVHQTALYDALWALVILAILLLLERRPRRPGFVFLSWAALYAAGRVVTDFLRVDKRWILDLTGSQLTSLAALLLCGYLLLRFRGAPPSRRSAEAATEGPSQDEAGGDTAAEPGAS